MFRTKLFTNLQTKCIVHIRVLVFFYFSFLFVPDSKNLEMSYFFIQLIFFYNSLKSIFYLYMLKAMYVIQAFHKMPGHFC